MVSITIQEINIIINPKLNGTHHVSNEVNSDIALILNFNAGGMRPSASIMCALEHVAEISRNTAH